MPKPSSAPHTTFYITGGMYKNTRLTLPPASLTRPTPARVREALFHCLFSLDFPLVGARILDGFSGSGAVGLECLSRGAAHVTCVESNSTVARVLQNNISRIKNDHTTTVMRRFDCMGDAAPFDLVFLDPPYGARGPTGAPLYEEALHHIAPHVHDATLFIIETEKDEGPTPPGLTPIYHKTYGRVRLSFFKKDEVIDVTPCHPREF